MPKHTNLAPERQAAGVAGENEITSLELTIAQLERENATLKESLYALSHDLKEPVRSASLGVELLARSLAGKLDEKENMLLSSALGAVNRSRRLLDDMLAYSKTGWQPQFQVLEIEGIVRTVLENIAFLIEDNEASVSWGDLPAVNCDRIQMVQLFQNLIVNAIKYRRATAPRIAIAAEKQRDVWLFSVLDNGVGFEQDKAEKIFQVFYRIERTNEGGTGIGLSICRKIVEAHGGKIWAESDIDKGSTFFFTLPTGDKEIAASQQMAVGRGAGSE
jgi:light-regulated signal transduction histidine kinase (bacteriophytochrome)